MEHLDPSGHGAAGEVEGVVWRIERKDAVDFLGKFVQHSKVDGKYLEGCCGNTKTIFNSLLSNNGSCVKLSKKFMV